MKFKHLASFALLCLLGSSTLDSCSPAPGPEPATTLNENKVGGIMKSTDSNVYNYALSCGCAFELKVEATDTAKNIRYDLGNSATSYTSHIIKAFPKAGLTKGTYTGWAALVTLQPDTKPDLRDTMRDTVIIP